MPSRNSRKFPRWFGGAAAALALVAGAATWLATSPDAPSPFESASATGGVSNVTREAETLLAEAPGGDIVGRPTVIDGDTIEIRGERIRIHGVDATESSQLCRDARGLSWRCGQQAALRLADWLGQRTVRCVRVTRDQYGRTVARCSVNGQDVGAWLVANGWAQAYRQYSNDYVALENEARSARRGIWQGEHVAPYDYRRTRRPNVPLPSGGCAIKGNINARGECVYHVPGSRWYDETQISPEKGERYFCSVGEAVAAGCRPSRD